MTEELSKDVPENDFYMQLRESENKLESEIESMQEMPEADMPVYGPMIEHVSSILSSVRQALRNEKDPEKVFAAAISGLSKVQQEQFILENILESLKNGCELRAIMARFQALGLLDAGASSDDSDTPAKAQHDETAEPMPEGGFFMRLRKKLGRSSMTLTKVALNAAKAAGKFVEIVPVIGFVGPIPTVSLQLQPKGASFDELLELAMDILEQS